jgi:hypothetical protein
MSEFLLFLLSQYQYIDYLYLQIDLSFAIFEVLETDSKTLIKMH